MTWREIEPELDAIYTELEASIDQAADEMHARIDRALVARETHDAFSRDLARIRSLPELA